MAAIKARVIGKLVQNLKWRGFGYCTAVTSTDTGTKVLADKHSVPVQEDEVRKIPSSLPSNFYSFAEYRFTYPEFLPDPQMNRRHKIREKLERMDMLKRRTCIEIPEFYVGSVLAVSVSEPYSAGKSSRFVGICILRKDQGLRAYFILRNVIDHQGVEIRYDLYNPTIQKIEVLKLEKRVDFHLLYLRDADPEFSTFPFDMEEEPHPEGTAVPVNPLKVKLKPPPWYARWERMNLKGIKQIELQLDSKTLKKAKMHEKPWEEFDLMKDYREHIPEEQQIEIWEEVHQHHQQMNQKQRKERRKRQLLTARKD